MEKRRLLLLLMLFRGLIGFQVEMKGWGFDREHYSYTRRLDKGPLTRFLGPNIDIGPDSLIGYGKVEHGGADEEWKLHETL
jgi:hypothetical protein